MIRKIQIFSYLLMLINFIQIGFWIGGAYGRNSLINIPTPVFFALNTILPFLIFIISFVMIIMSPKKLLSILFIPFTMIQIAFFCFIILVGILIF